MLLTLIGAAVIGLALGMLGSGGSILTVPVLTYLVGEPEKLAIAQSLGIVGFIALVGAVPYGLKRNIDWASVIWFGLPGMLGTYLGAFLSQWVPGVWQLGLFAAVMLLAAYLMFRPPKLVGVSQKRSHWKIVLDGLVVGVLTGLVGVGGGFLVVPALVLLGGLPMHLAVGTSLAIVALKSVSGFYKYLQLLPAQGYTVNWEIVLLFAVVGMAGSLLGGRMAALIPQSLLRQGFAGFLVVMGIFILWQNLPRMLD
jgi:uncharacterized membrane protein YfcA